MFAPSLDKLNSSDVKNYLLQIFKRDLPDANIDFKQEWDKAFAEVNAERAQYKAAMNQSHRIELLAASFDSRLVLRGKIIDWRPRIEDGLRQWQSYFNDTDGKFSQQLIQLRSEQSQQTERYGELRIKQQQLQSSLADIENDEK